MHKSNEITLSKLAKYANVSVKTASKVFSGDPSVRPYIKDMVLKAAKELDYRPNLLAQALRSKTLKIVSYHIAELENPFFGALFQAIEKSFAEKGYLTLPSGGIGWVNEVNRMFFACGTVMGGAIAEHIRMLVQHGPVISVGAMEPQPDVASNLAIDFEWAYEALADKAVASGRRKIALLSDAVGAPVNYHLKFRFLERRLAKHGVKIIKGQASGCYVKPAEIVSLLKAKPGSVDAVFCANDVTAAKLMYALAVEGLRIPGDVLVVGCDGNYVIDGMWSVYCDVEAIAAKTVDLMLSELAGKPRSNVVTRPSLVGVPD